MTERLAQIIKCILKCEEDKQKGISEAGQAIGRMEGERRTDDGWRGGCVGRHSVGGNAT
jgi:hypothetical protein